MYRPTGKTIFCLLTAALSCVGAADSSRCPFPVAAQFSEDMITLSWGPVEGASAFNVYADYGGGFRKVNFAPVASRNRFSLLWIESTGRKERVVKGTALNAAWRRWLPV